MGKVNTKNERVKRSFFGYLKNAAGCCDSTIDNIENASRTLELSNRLYPQYVKSNHEEKASILKFVASNYTLVDATVVPTYRKPFGILAEGLRRPKWLPGQGSNLGPAD